MAEVSFPAQEPATPGETGRHAAPSEERASENATPAREWASPGVSVRKRWLTGVGVAFVALLFIYIAYYEGVSMVVSTLIGVVFIGCFVWYLKIVAPAPFTIRLDDRGVTRTERGAEPLFLPWSGIAKIKEEYFKNGTPVSLTVYKRVGERGLHRSYVVYRDDAPDFDALLEAMRAGLPASAAWVREQVHE